MPSPTAGFGLSALPRAPEFPSNLGVFDPMGVSKNLRTGMTLMPGIAAENAQSEAAVPEAQLAGKQAALKSTILGDTAPMLARTAVLGAQADQTAAAINVQAQQRLQELRNRAASSNAPAALSEDFEKARALPSAAERASAIAALKFQYGWLGSVPEYANLVNSLDKAGASAESQAADEHKTKSAEEIAKIRAAAQEHAAQIISGGRLDVANVAAGSRKDVAGINAAARTDSARIRYDVGSRLESLAQAAQTADQMASETDDPEEKQNFIEDAAMYRAQIAKLNEKRAAKPAKGTAAERMAALADKLGTTQAAPEYKTPEDVKAAVAAGKLDKAAGQDILVKQFGFTP